MKKITIIITVLVSIISCTQKKNLTEISAKKASEHIIEEHNRTATDRDKITLLNWKSFMQTDENNAELKGVLQYNWQKQVGNYAMSSTFKFIKDVNNNWYLKEVSANGCGGNWYDTDVNYLIQE